METKLVYRRRYLFVSVDVYKKCWVVSIRSYDLELKTINMLAIIEELEKILISTYPGALSILLMSAVFSGIGFTIIFMKRAMIKL